MAKNIFNNIIRGNGQEKDLPLTRKSQIIYILKNNYGYLFVYELISFLFVLPAILFLIIMLSQRNAELINTAEENKFTFLLSYNFTTFLIMIPLIGLSGVGFVSMLSFIRNLAVEKGGRGYRDFFKGMKDNFIIGFIGFSIIALMQFVMVMTITYYGNSKLSFYLVSLLIAMSIIAFIISIIYVFYLITFYMNYKLKIKDLLKNSAVFTFKKFFSSLGIAVLALLPWGLIFFSYGPYTIWLIVMLMFIGLCYSSLIVNAFSLYVFDKNINITFFPDSYKRGLRKEVKNDNN